MTATAAATDRGSLRRQVRDLRGGLPDALRASAAAAVARHIAELRLLQQGARVAVYLPRDAELDTRPIVSLARVSGCRVYAPVVTDFSQRRMRFAALGPETRTVRNRWGVEEPGGRPRIHGAWLDLVIVPCVAFDDRGQRLGMGAGFYDRHFAYQNWHWGWRRPRLLGVAFDCQRVGRLEPEAWDVALWGVVTEAGVYGHAADGPDPQRRERLP
jgi:5-formyltetrahydrofolate cyclo-ligase